MIWMRKTATFNGIKQGPQQFCFFISLIRTRNLPHQILFHMKILFRHSVLNSKKNIKIYKNHFMEIQFQIFLVCGWINIIDMIIKIVGSFYIMCKLEDTLIHKLNKLFYNQWLYLFVGNIEWKVLLEILLKLWTTLICNIKLEYINRTLVSDT